MILFNIKTTLRRLSRSPMISFINLSGLALGIACAYLGIAYAQHELSYEKSFSDFDKIYRVGVDFMNMGGFAVGPEYLTEYMQNHSKAVASQCRVSVRGEIEIERQNQSVKAILLACDSTYFNMFDFPLLTKDGRTLLTDPDQAVISKDFALRWFGRTDVTGSEIELPLGEDVKNFVVAAVVDNTRTPTHMIGDIWIPIYPFLQQERSWYSAAYYTYFKLKDAADLPVFERELDYILQNEIYENFGKSGGLTYEDWKQKADAYRFIIHPLTDIHLRSGLNFEMSAGGNLQKVKGFLLIGLLILLVAIANYINLSTARSFTRMKEIGVKKSLGVSRTNLFRQFLGESLIESFFVVAGAMLMMHLILKLFESWTGTPLLSADHLSGMQMVIFLVFTLVIGLLTALYPAAYLSSFKLFNLVSNHSNFYAKNRLRSILVVCQFAITTWLICGSLVIFSQLKFMSDKDLGFDRDGLMVITNMESLGNSAGTFRQEVASNHLVRHSSFSQSIPGGTSIYQSTYKTPEMENSLPLRTLPVDESFLSTMGIQITEGRNFDKKLVEDTTVAIINESAKRALGLTDAIGADISNGMRVIGVVSDFHIESLKKGIQPLVLEYTPSGNILTLRLVGDTRDQSVSGLILQADKLWKELNPKSDLQYTFIDDTFEKFAEQEQIESKGIFALTIMALFIACLGLFGLTTFTMKKREKEISIRKILGAGIAGIVGLLTRDFLKLIFVALLIASPVAWYFMEKWLQNFAYRIDLSWWFFAVAGIMILFIALLTVSWQSVKAALINPVEKLRNE